MPNHVVVSQRRSGSSVYNKYLASTHGAIAEQERLLSTDIKHRVGYNPPYTCSPEYMATWLERYWEYTKWDETEFIHKIQVLHWDPALYPAFVDFFYRHEFEVHFLSRNPLDRCISDVINQHARAKDNYAPGEPLPDLSYVPTVDDATKWAMTGIPETINFEYMLDIAYDHGLNIVEWDYDDMVNTIGVELTGFQKLGNHFADFDTADIEMCLNQCLAEALEPVETKNPPVLPLPRYSNIDR